MSVIGEKPEHGGFAATEEQAGRIRPSALDEVRARFTHRPGLFAERNGVRDQLVEGVLQAPRELLRIELPRHPNDLTRTDGGPHHHDELGRDAIRNLEERETDAPPIDVAALPLRKREWFEDAVGDDHELFDPWREGGDGPAEEGPAQLPCRVHPDGRGSVAVAQQPGERGNLCVEVNRRGAVLPSRSTTNICVRPGVSRLEAYAIFVPSGENAGIVFWI